MLKKNNQRGLIGIEIIVVVLLVVVAVFVLWQRSQPHKTFTDAARVYQLSYPTKWAVDFQDSDSSVGKAVDPTDPRFYPNDGVELPCDTAAVCGPHHVNSLSVSAYHFNTTGSYLRQLGWSPVKDYKINGYQTY